MGEPGERRVLTVEEAASELGVNSDTIRRMLRRGELRGVKLGNYFWRIPREAMDEFLAGAQKQKKSGGGRRAR